MFVDIFVFVHIFVFSVWCLVAGGRYPGGRKSSAEAAFEYFLS